MRFVRRIREAPQFESTENWIRLNIAVQVRAVHDRPTCQTARPPLLIVSITCAYAWIIALPRRQYDNVLSIKVV
jgi:hypothetical protein